MTSWYSVAIIIRMRPYLTQSGLTLYLGDCVEVMAWLPRHSFDSCVTDPPYGETSLEWDERVSDWQQLVDRLIAPTGSMWCFGSLLFFAESWSHFSTWKRAQEIIWEKHNGSSFHADRFKRVHELAVQFYRGPWAQVYREVVTTPDATKRTTLRKRRPAHTGHIDAGPYVSEDGGPRMMRSVIYTRSCHGHAIAPTQKPIAILQPLIQFSTPAGGSLIDPFCGSGASLIAAHLMGRSAVGIDNDERQLERTAIRIRHYLRSGSDACVRAGN